MMDPTPIAHSPFSALTFVAAPALLTNATSVLALSTINRLLKTRDHMSELFIKSSDLSLSADDKKQMLNKVNRIEKQASLLLTALHSIYVALAAFACGTLVTLLGSGLESFEFSLHKVFPAFGLVLGFTGVGGLVVGCLNLFRATQISLLNIHDEANIVRERSNLSR